MDAFFHIRPFGFDKIFDIAGAARADGDVEDLRVRIAALSAELVLAQHDAEAMLQRGRAEGFAAGLAQAREEQAAALLTATDAIHAAVEGVDARLDDIADRTVREAAEIAHVAAGLLAGRAIDEAPVAAIDEAIGRVLRQVTRGQEIQVLVNPGLVTAVEALIAVRQAGDRRRLALTAIGDPAIAWGDAHIHWDQGGVILDAAARADAVREALRGVLPAA